MFRPLLFPSSGRCNTEVRYIEISVGCLQRWPKHVREILCLKYKIFSCIYMQYLVSLPHFIAQCKSTLYLVLSKYISKKTNAYSSSSSSSSCSWRLRHVSLFLDPQDEVGPSISSSVVLCFFVRLVYIVVLVLVVCLCPSFVHVVATFPGTVLFPVLCSVLQFFA